MGVPDMITPISYALSYPEHIKTNLPGLRLEAIKSLHFYEPDPVKFRCLRLAVDALKEGGSMPAVMNGANEIAVASFLKDEIAFLAIPQVIEMTMYAHSTKPVNTIETVLEADRWARAQALEMIRRLEK
jgi:1-deoxy-D-xylulose-5-phosphate reductoisomerase